MKIHEAVLRLKNSNSRLGLKEKVLGSFETSVLFASRTV